MDEPGRRDGERVAGQPRARGAIVEAHAERQQHVGLPGRVIGRIGAVARDQAERERMLAVDARRDRSPSARPESAAARPACNRSAAAPPYLHALPDQDHRALGREQHVDRLDDALRIGAAAARDIGVPFLRLRRLLGGRLLEDVERHVEHHRTGPPGHHRLPGLADRERHHVAARRLEHALAIGAHRRGKVRLVVAVELLEGAAVELAGRHVAGDGEKRHRVEERIAERDRQIGGARAARREGRGRLAGHAVVTRPP